MLVQWRSAPPQQRRTCTPCSMDTCIDIVDGSGRDPVQSASYYRRPNAFPRSEDPRDRLQRDEMISILHEEVPVKAVTREPVPEDDAIRKSRSRSVATPDSAGLVL